MASPRPRGSSIFSGLILLFIGVLLLLHNYRGFELSDVVVHWWPLVLIFWGGLKLYERTGGRRGVEQGAWGCSRPGKGFPGWSISIFRERRLRIAWTLRRRPSRRMRASPCAKGAAISPCAALMSRRYASRAK